ncbi:MAG TPA: DUF2059 domain-containing protein [Sphingomicrobium sp.]|jgi:hypothetical protein
MFRFSSGAIVALLIASPSLAQQPAAHAPDAARITAAEAYLNAIHYDQQVSRVVDAIIAQIDHSLDTQLSADPSDKLPDDLVKRIKGIAASHMHRTFAEHGAELKRGTALIYASHFTVPELQHLAQLQSDPVIARMQEELPQIAADTMALTQNLAQQEGQSVQDEVKTAVEDYLAHKSSKPTS